MRIKDLVANLRDGEAVEISRSDRDRTIRVRVIDRKALDPDQWKWLDKLITQREVAFWANPYETADVVALEVYRALDLMRSNPRLLNHGFDIRDPIES